MNITDVRIQNFLAVEQAKFNLASRGLVLIQGKNNDPSADSNGAGKSTLVDAICWALYGSTARGISTDAVVNRKAKKGCEVKVEIVEGDTIYTITRSRKPNNLTVESVDASRVMTNLTLGTDKETQKVIDSIMGCSHEVFTAAVYAGQEAMPDLPGMTDKQLKLLIEEAAGVERLADAYAVARSASATAASESDQLARTIAANEAAIAANVTELSNIRYREVAHTTAQAAALEALQLRAKAAMAEYAARKAEVDSYDTAALNAEASGLNIKNAGLQRERDKLRDLQTLAKTAATELERSLWRVEGLKKQAADAKANFANVEARIGTPCKECGKPYAEHDMETAKLHATKAVDSTSEALKAAVVTALNHKAASQNAAKAVTDFMATMTDVGETNKRLGEINLAFNSHANCVKNASTAAMACKQVADDMKAKKSEANPYEKIANANMAAELELRTILRKNKELHRRSTEKAELAEDAVSVFGPGGVRAHILDTVTPFLNDRTTEYLGSLSDGTIQAVWTTLSKTGKGELREKFSIDVKSNKGAESFAGLSGGEKRKVRLACAMALQDLVATRATKPIGLFIADEVDHALDESGLERLMAILDKKAKERGTVLVISHNSLGCWIDEVITVTKKDGTSTISGATGV